MHGLGQVTDRVAPHGHVLDQAQNAQPVLRGDFFTALQVLANDLTDLGMLEFFL